MPDYVNQFGPFWFEVFGKLGLYAVYSAWWFLLILGVPDRLDQPVHRAQCAADAARHAQLARERARAVAAQFPSPGRMDGAAARGRAGRSRRAERLAAAGYRVKMVDKDGGVLVAAKKGAANKFGYIFAHTAIIVILLGGLLDSNLPIRFQEWFMGKTPFAGNGLIAAHRRRSTASAWATRPSAATP